MGYHARATRPTSPSYWISNSVVASFVKTFARAQGLRTAAATSRAASERNGASSARGRENAARRAASRAGRGRRLSPVQGGLRSFSCSRGTGIASGRSASISSRIRNGDLLFSRPGVGINDVEVVDL